MSNTKADTAIDDMMAAEGAVPWDGPAAGTAGLQALGVKSVGEAGWLAPDNRAPPREMLLTVVDEEQKVVGFLPSGIVAMLAAPGGTGKSQVLTQLAVSCAGGQPWLATYGVVRPVNVLLVLGEEDDAEMHRRIRGAVDAMGWDVAPQLESRLFAMSLAGKRVGFVEEDGEPKPYFHEFHGGLAESGIDWGLIILDPASRFMGPDAETDNAQATRFVELMEQLTKLPGHPTVLFAHHTNKSALAGQTDQGAARGSSGLTDGVRWQGNLDRCTEPELDANGKPTKKRILVRDLCELHVTKANHVPVQPLLQLRRNRERSGFLEPSREGLGSPDRVQSGWQGSSAQSKERGAVATARKKLVQLSARADGLRAEVAACEHRTAALDIARPGSDDAEAMKAWAESVKEAADSLRRAKVDLGKAESSVRVKQTELSSLAADSTGAGIAPRTDGRARAAAASERDDL